MKPLMPTWKSHFAKPGATHRPNPSAEQQASAQPATAASATALASASVSRAQQSDSQQQSDTGGHKSPDLKPQRAGARKNPPPVQVPDTSWHDKYCELLIENGGQKTAAARGCNVTLSTIFNHRERWPEFAAAEKIALKRADDVCEAEARRRAIDGTTTTVTTTLKDGSVRVYSETKYSDTILLRLLEKNETGSWRQKQQIEHSGGMSFKTEAERKAALEKARAIRDDKPMPVEAINGRS